MARLLLLWLALCGLARAAPPLVFDAAEFAATSDARPPAANAAWRALPLPDLWRVHHPATLEHGWYRVRFARPADDAPLALYLPRLGMNAALWLNGHPLGDGGRMDEPLARNWNRPLLFVLPRERRRTRWSRAASLPSGCSWSRRRPGRRRRRGRRGGWISRCADPAAPRGLHRRPSENQPCWAR